MSILSSLSYVLFSAWGLIVVKSLYFIPAHGLVGEHPFRKVEPIHHFLLSAPCADVIATPDELNCVQPVFIASVAFLGRMLLLACGKGLPAIQLPIWPYWWRALGCTPPSSCVQRCLRQSIRSRSLNLTRLHAGTTLELFSLLAMFSALLWLPASSVLLMCAPRPPSLPGCP